MWVAGIGSPGCPLSSAGSAPEAPVEKDLAHGPEVPLALYPKFFTRSTGEVPKLFVRDPDVVASEDVLIYGKSLGREASLQEAGKRRFSRTR